MNNITSHTDTDNTTVYSLTIGISARRPEGRQIPVGIDVGTGLHVLAGYESHFTGCMIREVLLTDRFMEALTGEPIDTSACTGGIV